MTRSMVLSRFGLLGVTVCRCGVLQIVHVYIEMGCDHNSIVVLVHLHSGQSLSLSFFLKFFFYL